MIEKFRRFVFLPGLMLKLDKIKKETREMKKRIYNLGIILSYLTGAMIILNNIIYFVRYIRGARGNIFSSDMTNSDFVGAALYLVPSHGLSMGIAITVLTFFGLRQKVLWTWFLFLILIILGPLPILISQIIFNLPPFALLTVIFAIPAIAFTGPYVFSDEKKS